MPARKQVAKVESVPSPIGGLNSKDSIANMASTDAITLDNFFVQPTWVETRNGYSKLGTFTGNCETVMAFNSVGGTNQLYAAVVNASVRSIYRVDNLAGGAVGAAVVGGASNTVQHVTSTRYDWAQFGTGSAEVLLLVNGGDTPLMFDGTTWTASTMTCSDGSNASTLSCIAVYKQRLWFAQSGSMNVYYLPQNSYTGVATVLNMAPNFQMGGNIQAIVTISIDNSAGTNDYIAFVSNQGEVVIFQGYAPDNVATWYLAARFHIGRPVAVGRRTWTKIGMDALMIGADGFIKMSEAMLTDREQTGNAVSDKIRKSVTDDVTNFSTTFGWQVILYPIGNKIIINVPTTTNMASYQYVMNTLCGTTGGWSTWNKVNNGYNAYCWECMGDNLYFGTAGFVAQADVGMADGTSAITAFAQQAYNYMGDRGTIKRFTQVRPIVTGNGAINAGIQIVTDFNPILPTLSVPLTTTSGAIWNTSLWNVSYWGASSMLSKKWIGAYGVGYAASLAFQVQLNGVTAQWTVSDIMYEPGGPFG